MAHCELESRDRDAIALLTEAGVGSGSAPGLVWRLRYVDGLTDPEIAEKACIALASIPVYIARVNRKIRQTQWPVPREDDETAGEDVGEAEPEEEQDAREIARYLRLALANRTCPPDHAAELTLRQPVVSLQDLEDIIKRLPVVYLHLIGPPGHNRNWRRIVAGLESAW